MAIANTHDKGDLVRLKGMFTDQDGDLYDPSTVTVKFKSPSGVVTTRVYGTDDVTRVSVGIYTTDVNVDEVGTWHYRFESSGVGQAAEENKFYIDESEFD